MCASSLIDPQQSPGLAHEIAEKEAARRMREAILEIQSAAFDKATAYANVIILGGYAGGFTLWAYTRDHLPSQATILVALLLGISLVIFVLFEVYKMVLTHRTFLKQGRILAGGYAPRDFLVRLEALKLQASESSVTFMRVWGGVMVICVGTGLAAVGVLFYNFFALLLGLPLWPAG